jgi:RNA processing factor Prp31
MKKLIKFPGSKLQLLGAEKALKRAMEEGGKTPKHGIIVCLLLFP